MWGKFLDWIARTYLWFYHIFCQRPKDQPFTAQAARFEARWPTFAWGIALVAFYATAQFRGRWAIPTFIIYLFAWWFLPHICQYQRAHPENQPYKINKALMWAVRRLKRSN